MGRKIKIRRDGAWVPADEGSLDNVIKSTTVDKISASTTAPSSPTPGDIWFDTSALPEELAPSSIAWKETPTGAVNGSNTNFSTAQPYVSGSLQVFINGLAESSLVAESSPGSGGFTLTPAPLTGDNISVQYQIRTVGLGNADTVDGYHLSAILEAIYPVGSVYVSGSNTMPALIASIGTWSRVLGRVIVGLDESQTEFDTVNETGGHKLLQSHNHTHRQWVFNGAGASGSHYGFGFQSNTGATCDKTEATTSGEVQYGNLPTGGGDSQNLQPYKVKYMWERTA